MINHALEQNKKCLVYTRVSTDDQAEKGQSLEAQESICRKFAEDNGYEVLEIYQDPGRSGSDPNRPGLRALIERCDQDPTIEAMVTQDIDRLARDTLLYLSVFKDFQDNGIAIRFVNQPNVDGGLEGMLVGTIQAATSAYTAKQTGRKAKATMLEKAKMGWYPSWISVGYLNSENPNPASRMDRRIITPDKDRAPVIKELFKRYATGNYSILDLQNWLKEVGFKTRYGRDLSYSAIGAILTNPFYYGWLKWDSVEREGLHEPLIDKETFEQCQQVAAKHRNFACRKRKHNFLLRGFVFCKECGQRYVAEWHVKDKAGNKIAYYHCNKRTGCKQPVVEMSILQTQVEELFREFQFTGKFIDAVINKVQQALQSSRNDAKSIKRGFYNQMRALETKRNKLEDLIVEGVIDRDIFQRKHSESGKYFSYPPVRLWAIKPPVGLGDSTTLLLESQVGVPSEGLKDILFKICDELGEDNGDTGGFAVFDSALEVVTNFAALISDSAVPRFQLNINYFPGFAGSKIDLLIHDVNEQCEEYALPGCLFLSSSKEDFLEAFDEVLDQVRFGL